MDVRCEITFKLQTYRLRELLETTAKLCKRGNEGKQGYCRCTINDYGTSHDYLSSIAIEANCILKVTRCPTSP